jgi:pentose-5-phosphate-3-epimerase
MIVAAGADVLVAGNTAFSPQDPKATIAKLKNYKAHGKRSV